MPETGLLLCEINSKPIIESNNMELSRVQPLLDNSALSLLKKDTPLLEESRSLTSQLELHPSNKHPELPSGRPLAADVLELTRNPAKEDAAFGLPLQRCRSDQQNAEGLPGRSPRKLARTELQPPKAGSVIAFPEPGIRLNPRSGIGCNELALYFLKYTQRQAQRRGRIAEQQPVRSPPKVDNSGASSKFKIVKGPSSGSVSSSTGVLPGLVSQ